MRKQILWNSDWLFARGDTPEKATPVTLPHTWNAKDGQDGGNDYYRGTCLYTKAFEAPDHSDSEEVQTAKSPWVTTVRRFQSISLPKTGY